ncbi:DUF6355 family natural product biosynthesis protein [Amycolatopsis sp. OK19-0408]|uniref:DUF6355 family natural product biosynthesis protein n=1 Tax=Amycolatopsis iheyensis TaxID=2945988 RepID=A0A9X2SGE3_9PSEU|nr:DUF6355 family natural product biosynthesis protein [Amycolatopsis iheyensis]MCR6481269.1 DUF6355 family natural product biosynthesis protein [Amycolatopsis iheyensis]
MPEVLTIRTGGKLAAAVAAAALVLTGAEAGVAQADTPPSGCGFHVKDPGNPVYSSAWFNNCSYYPTLVHVDVSLARDRDVCVARKSDTFLGEYSSYGTGTVRNAWSIGTCGAA